MNARINDIDWTHLRSFVAVAETGSLTAAAARLGQSQPTVGRHIKAMEAALTTELFTRDLRGLTLTERGTALLAPAQEMAAAAARFANMAAGQDMELSGTVRITASVVVSHYLLPPMIAEMRQEEPGIEIELVPTDTTENLIFRQADIAVRMYRPTQLDVVATHVADQPLALYAARSLLERLGQPSTLEHLATYPFVGFDTSQMIIEAMQGFGLDVDRHFFGVRCDDQAAFWRLVSAGCGIGAMQTVIGDNTLGVARLDLQPELPPLPIWLVAPEALRTNARIRRVWEMLKARLEKRLKTKS